MQVLILEATFVPHPTDADIGPVLLEQGQVHECDKDTARRLSDAGKALYTAKADDPTKGHKTASKELLDAAAKAAAEAKRTGGKKVADAEA